MMFLAAILIHSTTPTAAYTCADVRAAVALVGQDEAIRRAKAAGATDDHIAEARKCFRRHRVGRD